MTLFNPKCRKAIVCRPFYQEAEGDLKTLHDGSAAPKLVQERTEYVDYILKTV